MTDAEELELIERLREEEALQRAQASWTCGACGAHYPKIIKKMNGVSNQSYAMRYCVCRFCGATSKLVPLKKIAPPLPIPQEAAPEGT